MNQAERALASATKEAQRQGNALDKLVGQIDLTIVAYSRLDKMEQQLKAHRDAGRLPVDDYNAYLAKLNETRKAVEQTGAAIGKNAKQLDANGLSAKQLAANLRGVPAQFTDIATSLQAGQNPLTVFLQQGGQLKDMFGGIGPAAKALGGYVLGLVNPFTLAAAAAAVLSLAYKQGSDETTAFTNALILNGNAAGTNADALASQAQSVSQSVGTVGAAAAVLAQLAASGKIPALAQSTSTPPSRSWAIAATRRESSRLDTSASTYETSPGSPTAAAAACRSSAAVRAASASRPVISTFAPFRAKTLAIPLPIPRVPPVTTTARPAIDVNMAAPFQ